MDVATYTLCSYSYYFMRFTLRPAAGRLRWLQLATSKKSLHIPVSETASRAVDRLDGETPLFHIKGKGGYLSNF